MIWDIHPGFRIRNFLHPGSQGKKSTGSRVRNTPTYQFLVEARAVSVATV
jgi:hypothetical protein